MTKVVFENMGVIDRRAIKTSGISIKETERPIGFFGTGLKYAIAVLLRTGHKITVYAGMEKIEFAVKTVTIRNQEVNLVTMDGEEMAFTTHLGARWEMWMAYRELYCNAVDEAGYVFTVDDDPVPAPYKTLVVVEGDEFLTIHHDRATFILQGKPLFKGTEAEVYSGRAGAIFYRGIKVSSTPFAKESAFTYNITRNIDLTEDRTVKYFHQIYEAVGKTITESANGKFIREALTDGRDSMEGSLDLSWANGVPSPEFIDTLQTLASEKITDVSPSALALFERHTAKTAKPMKMETSDVNQARLDRCIAFAKSIGFEVDRYQINIVDQLGSGTMALAFDNQIWIKAEVFDTSNQLLTHALIEEFVHLDTGYEDHTRDLQTYLFRKIVAMGEEYVLKEPV